MVEQLVKVVRDYSVDSGKGCVTNPVYGSLRHTQVHCLVLPLFRSHPWSRRIKVLVEGTVEVLSEGRVLGGLS